MISLLPFSSHTTFLPPIRIQQTYAVFHLPFLFTLLPLETGETHRLWVCIFSHMSPAVFFVSHSLYQSFPSTVPFCLLCTLWASKMVCYSMSRFDLIPRAERLLIYNLLWRGTAWLCMMCVHLQCQHQEPSWNRGRRHFHLCSNTVSALAPWHRCLCCTRQSLSSYHLSPWPQNYIQDQIFISQSWGQSPQVTLKYLHWQQADTNTWHLSCAEGQRNVG